MSNYRKIYMEDEHGGKEFSDNQSFFSSIWKKVVKFEETTKNIPLDFDFGLDKIWYCRFFSFCNIKSERYFRNVKVILVHHARYMNKKGILPDDRLKDLEDFSFEDYELERDTGNRFIVDIDDLISCIEETTAFYNGFDDCQLDPAISAIYLSWYGFRKEELPDLKKSAIRRDCVMHGMKPIKMHQEAISVLKRYRDSDGFYQQGKGIIFRRYIDSDYFFRTSKLAKMDVFRLSQAVSKLNTAGGLGFGLTLDNVFLSGAYNRLSKLEDANPGIEKHLEDPAYSSLLYGEKITRSDALKFRAAGYRKYKEFAKRASDKS